MAATAKVRVLVRVKPLLGDSQQAAGSALRVCTYEPPPASALATPTTGTTSHMDIIELTDTRFSEPEVLGYSFPAVYGPHTTQEEVFTNEVAPLVDSVLDGGSACMFAYGPTGTGKTHTLQGPPSDPGIVPRVAAALLNTPGLSVTVGFVEVYQERLYDLLVPQRPATAATRQTVLSASSVATPKGRGTARRAPLKLLEGADGHVKMAGMREVRVSTLEKFKALYAAGCRRRSTGPTSLNAESSRSHALLVIKVHLPENETGGTHSRAGRVGVLHIVDLAGNEDNRRTGNKGVRLAESNAINQSLFVLGKVIHGLNSGHTRVAYRDSKLTRLLQEALKCSHAALMICTVSPEPRFIANTKYTLGYAAQAAAMRVAGAGTAAGASPAAVSPPPTQDVDREAKLREWLKSKGKTPRQPRSRLATRSPAASTKRKRPSTATGKRGTASLANVSPRSVSPKQLWGAGGGATSTKRRRKTARSPIDDGGGSCLAAAVAALRSDGHDHDREGEDSGSEEAAAGVGAVTPPGTLRRALLTPGLRSRGVLDPASQARLERLEKSVLQRSLSLAPTTPRAESHREGAGTSSPTHRHACDLIAEGVRLEAKGSATDLQEALRLFQAARALVPSNTKLEQRIRSVEASLALVEGGANKENARGVTNKANEGETCFRTLEAQASSALETRLVALFNRGDTAELTSLKGIGPKRAESILRSREVDGPFARIADLTRIGLSKKVVVKICRDNIANGIEF